MQALRTLCLAVAVATLAPKSWAAEKLQYNRDIRPILNENCFACHGADSAARKADLRLDKRDVAVEMKAIVPGKPGESGFVERIFSKKSDEVMPPAKAHKTLTEAQKAPPPALGRRGGRVPAALVVRRPRPPGPAGRQGPGLGQDPHRPLRPGQTRGAGPEARPRGRPPAPLPAA